MKLSQINNKSAKLIYESALELILELDDRDARLTPSELDFVHDILVNYGIMTTGEMSAVIADNLADFPRGKNSLKLALVRLHILIHGELPLEMTPNPAWYHVPATMLKYASNKGYDVSSNLAQAKKNAESRPSKRNKDAALAAMFKFYQEHKLELNRDKMTLDRDNIVNNLMAGMDPEEVFKPYKK